MTGWRGMFAPPRHLLSLLVHPEVRVCLVLIRTSYRSYGIDNCLIVSCATLLEVMVGVACESEDNDWITVGLWYISALYPGIYSSKLMNDGFYLTIVNIFIYIRTFSNATNSCRGTSLLVLTGNKQRIMKVNGYYFIMKIATSWEWFQCLELFSFAWFQCIIY